VHRRAFKRDALENLCHAKDEAAELRHLLIACGLLNFYKGSLSLNPIAREISLAHLRDVPADFKQAHSIAADYHIRHFRSKQVVGTESKLGESFAELRYHLVKAGRKKEIAGISDRFCDHLTQVIKSLPQVPTDPEELDERIAVLTVLLGEGSGEGLDFHLARCLQARGRPGDLQEAVLYAGRALKYGGTEAAWRLYAALKNQTEGIDASIKEVLEGIAALGDSALSTALFQLGAELLAAANRSDEAVALLKQGIQAVPPGKALVALYQYCADLMIKTGKTGEAAALLADGIQVIPPDRNLFVLYQLRAQLLSQAGMIDDAVALLRNAIQTIPPGLSPGSLYQNCADLLVRTGKTEEAVALLRSGVHSVGPQQGLAELYVNCAQLLAKLGKTGEAVVLLKEGIHVVPPDKNLFVLYQLCAELLARAGEIEETVSLLREGIRIIPPDKNLVTLYQLCAEIMARRAGQAAEAVTLLREGIQAIPPEKNLVALYQSCAQILDRTGKTGEAVTLLREGLRVIPPDKSLDGLYRLYAQILDRTGETDEAVALLKEGLRVVPPDKNLFALYHLCAQILDRTGKTSEALALLKAGLRLIPPDKNLFSLYHLYAQILDRTGKTGEAVALLKEAIRVIPPENSPLTFQVACADLLAQEGNAAEALEVLKGSIQVVPPEKDLFTLYQTLSKVYCRAGRIDEAIAAQREGYRRISREFNGYKLSEGAILLCAATGRLAAIEEILLEAETQGDGQQVALGRIIQRQLASDWSGAAKMAGDARHQYPHYFALAALEAFSRLAVGEANGAWLALASFPNFSFSTGSPEGWLASFIHLRRGSRPEAAVALAAYLGRPVDEGRELNEGFLLRLWDQYEMVPEGYRLSFHFPLLPPSLSGLSQTVRRVQFGSHVLPPPIAQLQVPEAPVTPFAGADPDIYVSYAWGEDSTEAGRQREAIVDRLCEAVQRSGRTIGRDKDRMRGGDSIERFAHEISKARRIVAVISEKSLNSEFCMAHELFGAFQRCGYLRAEFQEKVIALVMDDAKRLLKDNISLADLATSWHERTKTLRCKLQSVDPDRKSPASWVFVTMLEDMCPRLPDMLGALQDIVMKRGFDEIVADGFAEVINRLPPAVASSRAAG
jgi:tetratricopeptide (TPR) repeat protein